MLGITLLYNIIYYSYKCEFSNLQIDSFPVYILNKKASVCAVNIITYMILHII